MSKYWCRIDKPGKWELGEQLGNKTSFSKYAEKLMQHWPHPAWHSGPHVCFCAETRRLQHESLLADQISWTLDEQLLGGRARGNGSGETARVSLRSCYTNHMNQPSPCAHALLHRHGRLAIVSKLTLSSEIHVKGCTFASRSLRKAVCPEPLLGQPRVDNRVEGMSLVYLGQLRRKRKEEGWQFIQGSYLTTGLWMGTASAYGGCTAGTNPQSLRSRSPTGVVFMYSYNYKQLFSIYDLPVVVWWELELQILRLFTAHPSADRLLRKNSLPKQIRDYQF